MKFFNTFALTTFALAPLTSAQESSTLEEKWAIGENPEFAYDSLDFTFTYTITDFIVGGQADYQLYTGGCKEDGDLLTNVTDGLLDLGLTDTSNTNSNTGVVNFNQPASVQVSVDPTNIVTSPLYSENNTIGDVSAQIVFCIRFGLNTPSFGDGSGTKVEVNFLETVVTLDVDLSDGFEIASVAVAPKDKLVRTAAQAYEVEGYICNEEEMDGDLTAVRNQGAQIRVCVRPNAEARADGIYMRYIDSFTWNRDDTITQEAVVDREEAGNTLTSLYCTPGELVCHFVSILFASFYATPGAVAGSGIASMQFGGDNTYISDGTDGLEEGRQYNSDGSAVTAFTKLRRNLRQLQDAGDEDTAATSEFDLSFDVDQGDFDFGDTSGASSTVGTMAMSLLAMAGVVAMI
mmetsp:Transcript_30189/g.50135  ORF Transcript_30189/g.50135 Transcript_30189/m.50135 type:complete len:404 (+) Transcript_30189:291-1502(+)